MTINFKKNWWLKWYWPFIEPLYVQENHYGTRQSAKSHNIARKLIYHSFKTEKFNVIHCRKVYADIEGSTFKLLTDLVYQYFPNDFIVRKDHFTIVNRHTGNWFRGLGMDKAEKGKGVEGANIAWMEEANQFTQEDNDYIDTTLRGNIGSPVSLIRSWNPERKNHWLYQNVQETQCRPDCLVFKSTFWDNYTIDRAALHEKLLRIKAQGPEGEKRYKVWALGDWGVEEIDKTFAYSFDSDLHVVPGKIKTLYDFPIHLSFDFNVTNTCGIQQFSKNAPGELYYATFNRIKTLRIGDLKALCEVVKTEYEGHEFIVTGDCNGNSRSAYTKDNKPAYYMIQNFLDIPKERIQVPKSNPSHIGSRFITNVFFQRCNVRISEPDNEILITDLKEAEVDNSGSLDPWKTKNPNKSHALDEFRYVVFKNFRELSKQYTL